MSIRSLYARVSPIGALRENVRHVDSVTEAMCELMDDITRTWFLDTERCGSYITSLREMQKVLNDAMDDVALSAAVCHPSLHPFRYTRVMRRYRRCVNRYVRGLAQMVRFSGHTTDINFLEDYANGEVAA